MDSKIVESSSPGVPAAAAEVRRDVAPGSVEYSKKHATTYIFTDIPAGNYLLKLRQRFKKKDGCGSPITAMVKAWKAASTTVSIERPGIAGQNLYQSQAEEQERPRVASKLPLNLNTYKFMGGEDETGNGHGVNGGYLLFSGPIQLDARESQNRITFDVSKNDTAVRVYAEH